MMFQAGESYEEKGRETFSERVRVVLTGSFEPVVMLHDCGGLISGESYVSIGVRLTGLVIRPALLIAVDDRTVYNDAIGNKRLTIGAAVHDWKSCTMRLEEYPPPVLRKAYGLIVEVRGEGEVLWDLSRTDGDVAIRPIYG